MSVDCDTSVIVWMKDKLKKVNAFVTHSPEKLSATNFLLFFHVVM